MVVRTLRETKGWSQEQMAEIAKLSTRTVQRVEEGLPASLDTRRALASGLGFEDIDALNKPYAIPTAVQLAEQQARFNAEHLTLKAQRIETGKQLGRAVEQCSAALYHEAVDLPVEAAEVFARLTDYCRDYAVCGEMFSAVDKLGIYEELEQMVSQLADMEFTLIVATRDTQLRTNGATDGVPISILYVVAFPKGKEAEQLLVAKNVKFGL